MINYQICSNCDTNTDDLNANFCVECGYSLDPSLILCKNCKQKLSSLWSFCKNCGARIRIVNVVERHYEI